MTEYANWNTVHLPKPWLPNAFVHATSNGLDRACMTHLINLEDASSTPFSTSLGKIVWTAPPPPESPVRPHTLTSSERRFKIGTMLLLIPAAILSADLPHVSTSMMKCPRRGLPSSSK